MGNWRDITDEVLDSEDEDEDEPLVTAVLVEDEDKTPEPQFYINRLGEKIETR